MFRWWEKLLYIVVAGILATVVGHYIPAIPKEAWYMVLGFVICRTDWPRAGAFKDIALASTSLPAGIWFAQWMWP